jgi:hypothetical protein
MVKAKTIAAMTSDGLQQRGAAARTVDLQFDDGEKLGDEIGQQRRQRDGRHAVESHPAAIGRGAAIEHRGAATAAGALAGSRRALAVENAAIMTADQIVSMHR